MNEDGMSYLDMAVLAANGHLASLVHLYWSPLYPALIAGLFRMFSPSQEQEFPLVHLLNAVIGLAALFSFSFFLRAFLGADTQFTRQSPAKRASFILFGYSLFLWSALQTAGVHMVTPDLLVNALVFLIAGFVLRIESLDEVEALLSKSWFAALLGLALGIAAWAKAAMLPLGIVLLALLFIFRGRTFPRRLWLIATVIFALSAAPLFLLMSQKAHRLTFGESGRINYAWMIQAEIPVVFGWTDGGPNTGTPLHPPRVLNSEPKVFEYANTTDGTYPPWYDPAYFHEGLRIRFLPAKQWHVFWKHLNDLRWGHGRSFMPLLFGFLFLCWKRDWKTVVLRSREQSWLLLWPVLAIVMYALVFMQARYLSAFLVLLWLALFRMMLFDTALQTRARANSEGGERIALGLVTLGVLVLTMVGTVSSAKAYGRPQDLVIAEQIRKSGLQKGDAIVLIGPGFNAYFAHLSGLRIIGEVEDPDRFWALSQIDSDALIKKLQSVGAKAVISMNGCPADTPLHWKNLGAPGYCIYRDDGRSRAY
jgi:hypothetical protein